MTQSQTEAVMRLLAAMMIFDRAKLEKRTVEDVFREFRRSRTFDILFDKDTGLWMNGPDYIAGEYDLELQRS